MSGVTFMSALAWGTSALMTFFDAVVLVWVVHQPPPPPGFPP